MAKVRVYELAKEFDVESKAVMAKLQEMGEFVRSASSTIEAPVVRRLREAFAAQGPKQSPARKADGQVATAPPNGGQDGRSAPTPRTPSPRPVAEEPVAPRAAGDGVAPGSVTAAEPAAPAAASPQTAPAPAAPGPAPQVPFSPPPARPGPPSAARDASQPGSRQGQGAPGPRPGPRGAPRPGPRPGNNPYSQTATGMGLAPRPAPPRTCLLYTSDAADE